MSEQQKIRIKLKAYDHKSLDLSAAKIVETAKKDGCRCFGAYTSSSGAGDDAGEDPDRRRGEAGHEQGGHRPHRHPSGKIGRAHV